MSENLDNPEEFAKRVLEVVDASEFGKLCKFLMAELKTNEEEAQVEETVAETENTEALAEEEMAVTENKEANVEEEVAQAEKRKYSRLESENAQLKSRLDNLEKTAKVTAIKAELQSLEAENIKFDYKDEYTRMMSMANPVEHANLMRKCYSRNITGVDLTKQYQPTVPEMDNANATIFDVMNKFEYDKSQVQLINPEDVPTKKRS